MDSQEELIEALESAPKNEILGIVSALGVGCMGDTLLVSLSAWRPLGGNLRKCEITFRKLTTHAEYHNLVSAVHAYDVVRLGGRWLEQTIFGSPQALLLEFMGKDHSDLELNAYALELQKPVTFDDPHFGLLTLDRRFNWYNAKVNWCGESVELHAHAKNTMELQSALDVARKLWADQEELHSKATACATNDLLKTKSENWLDEGEEKLSAAEFASMLIPTSITAEPDGTYEIWFDAGDMFLGHILAVYGNITDGPEWVAMHG